MFCCCCFFITPSHFFRLISALAWTILTKLIWHMFDDDQDLQTYIRNLRIPPQNNWHKKFGWFQTPSQLNSINIRIATRYHKSENSAENYDDSHTWLLILVNVHPQSSKNRTRVSTHPFFINFFHRSLQRVSIACYAERCISYSKSVRLSVRLSVRPSHAGTELKQLKLRSWGLHWRIAPWL